jgi:hypothetical protein
MKTIVFIHTTCGLLQANGLEIVGEPGILREIAPEASDSFLDVYRPKASGGGAGVGRETERSISSNSLKDVQEDS